MPILSSDRRTTHLAADAAFTGAALLLSFVEAVIPLGVLPLPGFKLGLCNLAITAAAFRYSVKDAAAVSLCRILLNFLLFGSPTSLIFSLTGGLLVLFALNLLTRPGLAPRFSFLGISVLCAMMHNAGQLAAARILLGPAVGSYLPALAFASLLFGGLNGVILNRLPDRIYQPESGKERS